MKKHAFFALLVAAVVPMMGADGGGVWTDPELALAEDSDFPLQGEYGSTKPGAPWGLQMVAAGEGKFDAFLLAGGLPGLGWERGNKRLALKGERKDGRIVLEGAGVSASIAKGIATVKVDGRAQGMPRIERCSPSLGAKPPASAVVLFDGSSADQWKNGKLVDGLLASTSCTSKQKFRDYKLHLEFRTPYMPAARGQKRGNSGVYHQGRWETQVLDSFGLEGRQNECGGIYSIAEPALNMCLPPLAWQTYDVEFTAAKFAADGSRTAWPRITVRLNGVVVHEDLELPKTHTTAAPITSEVTDDPGPIFLQNHKDAVFYRNIWVLAE